MSTPEEEFNEIMDSPDEIQNLPPEEASPDNNMEITEPEETRKENNEETKKENDKEAKQQKHQNNEAITSKTE